MLQARRFVAWVRVAAAASLAVGAAGCAAFHGSSREEGEGAYAARSGDRGEEQARCCGSASLFSHPWVFTDERGERVTFARWRGAPVLVTAVYTQCQATCPRTIGKLRSLYASFVRAGKAPEFVLVTLDPRDDTPERLLRFKQAQGFPDAWHLWTGGAAETSEVADLLDIHVLNADSHIMHDARIVIFDAQGRRARSYSGWSLDDESAALERPTLVVPVMVHPSYDLVFE
jgi:protein SCO1